MGKKGKQKKRAQLTLAHINLPEEIEHSSKTFGCSAERLKHAVGPVGVMARRSLTPKEHVIARTTSSR